MLKQLLRRYNHYRLQKYFQSPLFHARKSYAFVGFGIHSMTNLYPLLRHFNIRLKYICTHHSDWKEQLAPLFPGCSFTNDLRDILQDDDVAGVFVCASPEAHYPILTDLLGAGKSVWVEKPPCLTLPQLQTLVSLQNIKVCKVGLQRRYWPGNPQVLKNSRTATSYVYQFQTGAFPGDAYTELFIHPLDYARFLFGEYTIQSFSRFPDNKGITLQLHVLHANNVSGLIHLSTHYGWNPPLEYLAINGEKESLTVQYPTTVTGRQIPFRIMNIPAERWLNRPAVTKEYFSGSPSLLPTAGTNSWLTQGFLPEIETFVSLVEGHPVKPPVTTNDLPSLLGIYDIIEKLKG